MTTRISGLLLAPLILNALMKLKPYLVLAYLLHGLGFYKLYTNHALLSPRFSGSSSFFIDCLFSAFKRFSRPRYAKLAAAKSTVAMDITMNVIVANV